MTKNIFITGGTGGIGKSLIHKFAKNNYNIFFTYFNLDIKNLNKEYEIIFEDYFKKEIKILNEFASDKLLTFGKNNIALSETGKHFSNLVGSIFDGYIKTPRFNEKIKSNKLF